MSLRRILAAGLAIVGCGMAGTLRAQGPGAGMQGMQAALGAQMKKNKAELRKYSWKQRVELQFKGEDKSTKLDQLHYDASGELVRAPLSAPPPAQEKRRRIGGRIKAKKVEELKDYIQRLMLRVQRYTDFSGGDPAALMDKAMIGKGQGANEGMIVVHISNFVITGDSVDISIDPATQKMRKIVIATMLDDDPINVNADFQDLPNGPTYMANATVDSPKKELGIRMQNFDYVLLR
ncbi:MAG: hypothetical protein ACRD4K_00930 [Candidatus Acidiferrales bacterium]